MRVFLCALLCLATVGCESDQRNRDTARRQAEASILARRQLEKLPIDLLLAELAKEPEHTRQGAFVQAYGAVDEADRALQGPDQVRIAAEREGLSWAAGVLGWADMALLMSDAALFHHASLAGAYRDEASQRAAFERWKARWVRVLKRSALADAAQAQDEIPVEIHTFAPVLASRITQLGVGFYPADALVRAPLEHRIMLGVVTADAARLDALSDRVRALRPDERSIVVLLAAGALNESIATLGKLDPPVAGADVWFVLGTSMASLAEIAYDSDMPAPGSCHMQEAAAMLRAANIEGFTPERQECRPRAYGALMESAPKHPAFKEGGDLATLADTWTKATLMHAIDLLRLGQHIEAK